MPHLLSQDGDIFASLAQYNIFATIYGSRAVYENLQFAPRSLSAGTHAAADVRVRPDL